MAEKNYITYRKHLEYCALISAFGTNSSASLMQTRVARENVQEGRAKGYCRAENKH